MDEKILVDRTPIVISISNAGAAPVLAWLLRAKLESMLPAAYGKLGNIAQSFRDQLKAKFNNLADRGYCWENVFGGPIAKTVFKGKETKAKQPIQQLLDETHATQVGEVYLMGGGLALAGAINLSKQLIAYGIGNQMPIVLIERDTTKEQKVWVTTLVSLSDTIKHNQIKPPALVIVGCVVNLRKKLQWLYG